MLMLEKFVKRLQTGNDHQDNGNKLKKNDADLSQKLKQICEDAYTCLAVSGGCSQDAAKYHFDLQFSLCHLNDCLYYTVNIDAAQEFFDRTDKRI